MKKSLGVVAITPFVSFAMMYAFKKAKTDVSRADNFMYRVLPQSVSYARSGGVGDVQAPVPQVGKEESMKEA